MSKGPDHAKRNGDESARIPGYNTPPQKTPRGWSTANLSRALRGLHLPPGHKVIRVVTVKYWGNGRVHKTERILWR